MCNYFIEETQMGTGHREANSGMALSRATVRLFYDTEEILQQQNSSETGNYNYICKLSRIIIRCLQFAQLSSWLVCLPLPLHTDKYKQNIISCFCDE